jgi:import inner membrane translocase subunit TIM23
MNSSADESDAGAPLPDFRTQGLQLQTIAPALGVINQKASPDYLDYDVKGRGIFSTMFANSGMAYLLGISAGGIYGFRQGLAATPSTRFRVQVNSVLNHCGRYGSRAGNALGVFAVLYSFYEGVSDRVSLIYYVCCHLYRTLPHFFACVSVIYNSMNQKSFLG